MTRLKAEQLTLAYDRAVVIPELDLSIPPRQITALVGPNGCGKSTLLRGLSRLLPPQVGTVYLDGRSIHQMPSRELAQQLGVLPQNPSAPDGLTVYELVAQGRYPHQGFFQQWSEADERATQAALQTTSLVDLAHRPLDTLSGGQRQRAWIAMALAQETEILLLDEPTTFLDLAYQMEVLDLLRALNEQGRTIVLVLHDLNQACRYAHQLVAMRDGRVVAQGAPEAVMSEQLLRRVFNLHARIVTDPVTETPLVVPVGRAQQGAQAVKAPLANGNGPVAVAALGADAA